MDLPRGCWRRMCLFFTQAPSAVLGMPEMFAVGFADVTSGVCSLLALRAHIVLFTSCSCQLLDICSSFVSSFKLFQVNMI